MNVAIDILIAYCVVALPVIALYLIFGKKSRIASSSEKSSVYACGEKGSPTDPPIPVSYLYYLLCFIALESVPILAFICFMFTVPLRIILAYLGIVLIGLLVLIKR